MKKNKSSDRQAPKSKSKLNSNSNSNSSSSSSSKSKAGSQKANQPKTEKNPGIRSAKEAGKLHGTVMIEENKLDRFENRTHVRRYTIEFTCPEFTCLCPKTGFPDFATIRIKYVPDQFCVELKSLKLYINGFRDKHVFHEDVTNVIIQDMIDLLDPWEISVVGDFTVRGNIHTVITANHLKNT